MGTLKSGPENLQHVTQVWLTWWPISSGIGPSSPQLNFSRQNASLIPRVPNSAYGVIVARDFSSAQNLGRFIGYGQWHKVLNDDNGRRIHDATTEDTHRIFIRGFFSFRVAPLWQVSRSWPTSMWQLNQNFCMPQKSNSRKSCKKFFEQWENSLE